MPPSPYLQEAGVGPDRQVELGSVGDEQDVAVDVDGGPDGPEEKGEDVARLVGGDDDGGAEVLHLHAEKKKTTQKEKLVMGASVHRTTLCSPSWPKPGTWFWLLRAETRCGCAWQS